MKWMLKRNLSVTVLALGLLAPAGVAQEPAKSAVLNDLPQVRTVSTLLGDASLKSASGQQIELLEFAPPGDKRGLYRFLVQGGLHGNEQQASAFVVWVARRYARGESILNQLPKDQVAIDFLPFANPDGTHGHSRYNARGVNLNRNFAVLWGLTRENPGKESFSEPETRVIRRLFKERKYTAAVDVHGYINWIVAPSDPADIANRGFKPSKAQKTAYAQWVDDLKREMQLLPGYQFKTGAKLGDGGAFEDWAFWSEGTLAYCLELESLQRFVRPYRPDFSDLTKVNEAPAIDLFKRYEMFVYRMFVNALRIKQGAGQPSVIANEPPARQRSGT